MDYSYSHSHGYSHSRSYSYSYNYSYRSRTGLTAELLSAVLRYLPVRDVLALRHSLILPAPEGRRDMRVYLGASRVAACIRDRLSVARVLSRAFEANRLLAMMARTGAVLGPPVAAEYFVPPPDLRAVSGDNYRYNPDRVPTVWNFYSPRYNWGLLLYELLRQGCVFDTFEQTKDLVESRLPPLGDKPPKSLDSQHADVFNATCLSTLNNLTRHDPGITTAHRESAANPTLCILRGYVNARLRADAGEGIGYERQEVRILFWPRANNIETALDGLLSMARTTAEVCFLGPLWSGHGYFAQSSERKMYRFRRAQVEHPQPERPHLAGYAEVADLHEFQALGRFPHLKVRPCWRARGAGQPRDALDGGWVMPRPRCLADCDAQLVPSAWLSERVPRDVARDTLDSHLLGFALAVWREELRGCRPVYGHSVPLEVSPSVLNPADTIVITKSVLRPIMAKYAGGEDFRFPDEVV